MSLAEYSRIIHNLTCTCVSHTCDTCVYHGCDTSGVGGARITRMGILVSTCMYTQCLHAHVVFTHACMFECMYMYGYRG